MNAHKIASFPHPPERLSDASTGGRPSAPAPGACSICNDTYYVIAAGPDENGMYDADDCPCQTEEKP